MQGSEGGAQRASGPRRGRWSQQEFARLKELYGLRDDAAIARELNRPVSSVRKVAESLFRGHRKTGPWTAAEVQELKRYLGATTEEVIGRILGRPVDEIRQRITELGRIEKSGNWSRREIAEFKKVYGTRTDQDLARIFERSEEAVVKLARQLSMSKDKAFLRKLNHGRQSVRMPRWTDKELTLLRELYPSEPNLAIAKQLGRSVKSVVSKAHNLGLKKSSERLRKMGRENVSLRYRE